MTRKELPARAANIQRAVASTTTCTPATVESLRSFLLPRDGPVVQKKPAANIAEPKPKASSVRPVGTAGARARKQPVVDVLEVLGEADAKARTQDRIVVATEVVNTTLKALSEAIKNPPVQKRRAPLRRTSSNASFSNGVESRSQTPLQPLSVNRLASLPDEKCPLRRSSSTTSIEGRLVGLRAQAECSRIAFATLRSVQDRKGSPSIPHLQLESGMSALIGRLITLGFDDLAMKELRILKRRLEAVKGSSVQQKATKPMLPSASEDTAEPKTETLVDILKFSNPNVQGLLLALIITTQMQTLKVLALSREAAMIEAALQHLRLDVAHSPANMIQRQIKSESPESRNKAAQQLESLAQSLIALCPSQSSADDYRLSKSSGSLTPHAAFEIQLLAFQIRSMWWKMSGHRTELATEMINPFTRCLATFHRRSKVDSTEKYEFAVRAFELIVDHGNTITGFREEMLLAAFQVLADMAQESSQNLEASRWVKKSRKSARECGVSQTRLCILDCRLASLLIRASGSESSEYLMESLQTAVSSLRGNLQGESAELDELLIIVASLRRSAFSVVQDAHRQCQTDRMQSLSMHVETCSEIVLLCVRFVLRYVGNGSSRQGDEKTAARREQRRVLAAQVAYPAIESIAAMANLSAKAIVDEWSKLDAGLRDCLGLALILEGVSYDDKKASGEAKRAPLFPFASISNAYWYRYLHLKQVVADAMSVRDCLRMSIDILQNRSPCERSVGYLPMKLEIYAQLCESMRDYKKAAEAYQEAIHAHVANGLLSTAAEAATVRSMPNALEDQGELIPLSQSLVAYLRAALKANDQGCSVRSFYDDTKLCDGERGVLLEQQLIALLYIFQDQGSTPTITHAMTTLTQTLLQLYTEEAYPVRRFRVIVRLLAVLSIHPDALDEAKRDQILGEPAAVPWKSHLDMGLLQFLPHLTVCRDVLVSLSQGTLDVKKIEAVMDRWSKLLHKHPNLTALQAQVYDISDWLSQLESLAEFLEMQGLGLTRISVLNVLVTIHEASTSLQCSTLVSKLSELALQYSRVGYSGAADVILRKAEVYLATSDVPTKTALRYHIVKAEIAHASGNLKSCDNLDKARELFQANVGGVEDKRLRSRDQRERSLLVGDAAYLLSLLAAAEGRSPKALYLARLCVKSYQRAWAILERSKSKIKVPARAGVTGIEHDTIVDSLSELSISECGTVETMPVPQSPPPPCGAVFWSIVPRLSRGFAHLSFLFTHHGLLPEVRYYLSQAQRIALTVQAPALIGHHSALLGHYTIRGGDLDKGSQLLQQAESMLSGVPRGRDYVSLQLFFASHYARRGQWKAGHSALDAAEMAVESLTKKAFIDALVHKQSASEDLDLQISTLTLKETKAPQKPKFKARNNAMRKNPVTKLGLHEDSTANETPAIEAIALKRIRGDVLRERATTALGEGDIALANVLLNEAPSFPCDQRGIVAQALLSSRIRYNQKLEQLVADPVFCVIPESTISHPSIRVCGDRQERQSTSHAALKAVSAAPLKHQRGKTPADRRMPRSPSLCKTETDVLRLAQVELTEVVKLARKVSSTVTLHQITDALGKILLLLSATSSSTPKPSASPTLIVYILEFGRILSTIREFAAIEVERQLSLTKLTHHWPGEDASEDDGAMGPIRALEFVTFQADYIDIIPASWTAISMTLSASREEILICKIRAGQSPFILRLPLTRHTSLESDEETFGFDQGRAELQDIVLSTNHSTHRAQDLSQKGAKRQWWEARTALDARLKDLLNNIEGIWFGGFKSVFSHSVQDSNLLARFQQSLQNILDKHLPSRQKSGRGTQSSRVVLDHSVLELFIGLGSPSDSNDVDEPLMDLLYFVVDILQFNGERNAYDEVDFDAIAIETIDTLRHYHQAVKDEVDDVDKQHTILVLDRRLHCFPWESLPCLSGKAVSRLPSLGCLRDRIMQQREVNGGEKSSSEAGKVSINRNNGTSILNPGGDLNATQSRFEEPLQGLPGWETIIQREPTETEMKDYLENRGILLYFGHGSGGQYIRPRTIKKLEKCAVALLMGCSSGALTEAGEFEPYGTPMNYMHAGCPAMLATLWDVTDKDIDKFSSTVLEKWGLFGDAKPAVPSSPVKKSARQRGKSKAKDVKETNAVEKGPVSLDEAVAQGRESCLLKYLNGAAPVVYGVPVFLSN